jgi:DNA-binding transcriptional regulator YdaS (Cro superfamily)
MKLIDYLSEKNISQSELATFLKKTAGRVGHWCRGVDLPPPAVCVSIEKWSNGIVTRKDLRPNDWQDFWPELVEESV